MYSLLHLDPVWTKICIDGKILEHFAHV
jgi:hypothetical protein